MQVKTSILTFIFMIIVLTTVTGCNSHKYQDAIAEGQSAMAANDYNHAIKAFSQAVEKDPQQQEAKELLEFAKKKDIANQIQAVENDINAKQWKEAIKKADAVLKEYESDKQLKELTTKAKSSMKIAQFNQ
ncbi:hypothetical protein JFL43_08895 [Viridibacillus sp. YIM B01967]|uniref:Tetratricopeptide repeat protein n=1 Tax=Viridibacillus soli TaxID=2798301 RepID=A0ABS1H6Q2_9BACL|nr:hypothetical protein [Viridibacillus soli]MBK3494976.1 hypothetical protein [Viridibacillus soli]